MNIYYTHCPRGFFIEEPPGESFKITKAEHRELLNGLDNGLDIEISDGKPILCNAVLLPITADQLFEKIDCAADVARASVAGNLSRDIEYDRAYRAALEFAASGYAGDVPKMVSAWAVNGRTAEQAAKDIINAAEKYTALIERLREIRLSAKESIRLLSLSDEVEAAIVIAEQAVSDIEAAVSGIGNQPV